MPHILDCAEIAHTAIQHVEVVEEIDRVHCYPLIAVFARRELDGLSEISRTERSLCVFLELLRVGVSVVAIASLLLQTHLELLRAFYRPTRLECMCGILHGRPYAEIRAHFPFLGGGGWSGDNIRAYGLCGWMQNI